MPKRGRPFTAVPKSAGGDSETAAPLVTRAGFDFLDGSLGILFLLILASFCGALIAVYWPFSQGPGEANTTDRLSTLESKVDAMAAGHASGAAAQVFVNQRREIAALRSRVDADEARLALMEKSENAAGSVDVSGVNISADRNASDLRKMFERVAALEQTAGAQAFTRLRKDLSDRTDSLHEKISSIDERISSLEKSAPPAGLAQRLDSFALKSEEGVLESRIVQLEGLGVSDVMRRTAAVMALADLVRASSGGEPFGDELAELKILAPAAPEIQDLARYAAKGVPTKTMLADSFSRQADAILAIEHASAGKTWTDRVLSRVLSAYPMRTLGNIVGNDPEAHVARAEVDLNIGEVARAIREVSALPAPAREVAEPWLKSANGRVNVDHDAHTLAQRLVADLSAKPAPAQISAAGTSTR